jgi:hypothetical protein
MSTAMTGFSEKLPGCSDPALMTHNSSAIRNGNH